jgi:nucleotide-binding universal stress UspA family protein
MSENASAAVFSTERAPRILVGLDGSPSSIDALRSAVDLACAFSGTVEAIGAWHLPASLDGYYPPDDWSPKDDAMASIREAIESVFGKDQPSWLTASVHQGPAARVLVDASADADLLIVGSRGYAGVVGLMLGSVSAACAEKAHCPVLIMHEPRASVSVEADAV